MENNTGEPSVESLIKRGCLFLEDSEWNKADEYFDKALDINPEHAPAYIGKLCVELMVRREETLGDYKKLRQSKKFDRLLGEYDNFKKALHFANDSYLKKLNVYDQKIKENFPKTIPKRFTDEFIKDEITRLENEIANCNAEIVKSERFIGLCEDNRVKAINKQTEMVQDINNRYRYENISSLQGLMEESIKAEFKRKALKNLEESYSYKMYEKDINDASKNISDAYKCISEYKNKKAEYETKKKKIEPLVSISCLDRMDGYYNRLVKDMKKESTEEGYLKLAKQFIAMNGYKDTIGLANECKKAAIKVKYNNLVLAKNKASTESEYQRLAPQFKAMNGYKDTTELANECEKAAVIAKYDYLFQAKNRASTEGEYQSLAPQFRAMNGYKDTIKLANECDDQYQKLKKSREEQEQIERKRKAAQEKKEREECERFEAEELERQRIEEETRKAKERAIKIRKAIILTASFFIIISGVTFLIIRQKNIEKELMREYTTVSAQVLPVHEGPSADYKPVDEISQNGKVEILERKNGSTWVKINYGDGKTGYVDSEHLWRAPGIYAGEIYKGSKDLSGAVKWISKNAIHNGQYTIVLGKDEYVNSINLSFNNMLLKVTFMTADADEKNINYKTQPKSSLVTVGRGVTFIMEEGVNLEGRHNNTRRLVSVEGGDFIMNGGSIKYNKAKSNGGGVVIESGSFTMNNGTISGNTAYESGGGVIIFKGTFTMNDGTIKENTATGSESGNGGGGVSIEGGNFIMHNGIITLNSTDRSGGGVIINKGTFTMNNGTISENRAPNRNGGGIHIQSGTFTMNNGTINGNSCNWWGGGVNVPEGNFTMNNGIISGNKAQYGGGVSVREGTFKKSGRAGIIYGSNASNSLANKADSNDKGHAVVLSDGNSKVSRLRNSTVGTTQAMDSSKKGAAGGWQ
jgi:uncharacterized protein YgiM (DUF1202 family)